MVLTYRTLIHLIVSLACLHSSLQEATSTAILPWSDEENVVPRPVSSIGQLTEAEDAPTLTPAWLLDNEVQASDLRQTERNLSSDVNHEQSNLGPEQIHNDISLPNETWTENETAQSITPMYKPTDEQMTEGAIEEPPTVPLVIDAQLSTSHWPESSSESSTSAFSTASSLPLDPINELESSADESLHYLLKESDLSTIALSSPSYPDVVSDVPFQPYILDVSEKSDLDLRAHEEENATGSPSVTTHEKDGEGAFLSTEDAPLVTSEIPPKKGIEGSTAQPREETDEETSSLAMAENLTGKRTYL